MMRGVDFEERQLPLGVIRHDLGTQTRAAIDYATAEEYAEVLLAGDELPSLDVFFDGATYYLACGFHRREGHAIFAERKKLNHDKVLVWCRIFKGGAREAILHGLSDNLKHGLRLSNEDKRRGVSILLADPEWSQWSNAEIARRAGCSGPLVADVREKLSLIRSTMGGRKVTRNGTTYTMAPGGGRPKQPQANPWFRAAVDSGERLREAVTHLPGADEALAAADLTLALVRDLQKAPEPDVA